MRLFKQTPEDYYNAPYAEFPSMEKKTHHGDEMFVFSAIGLSF